MNGGRPRWSGDLLDFTEPTRPRTGKSRGADEYLAAPAFILQAKGAGAGTRASRATPAVPIGTAASGPPSPGAGFGAPGAAVPAGTRQAQTTADDPTPPAGRRGGPPSPASGLGAQAGGRGAGGRGGAPAAGQLGPTSGGT